MKKISRTTKGVVSGLMDYLKETGQSEVLGEVTDELQNLEVHAKGADTILVSSPVAFTRSQKDELKKIIRKYIGENLPVQNILDRSLIGGFTVQVGDWFLDASIKKQIKNLKSEVL